MNNHNLYDYIFHKNTYTGLWAAIKRGKGNYEKYINGEEFEGFKSKKIETLIEYIHKKSK